MAEPRQTSTKKPTSFSLDESQIAALSEMASMTGKNKSELVGDLINKAAGPDEDDRPMIITTMNHKGGVAKTTTVANLAMCLAQDDNRVLIIDLDSQGNISQNFNRYDPTATEPNIADVMLTYLSPKRLHLRDVMKETDYENVYIVPCSFRFSGADAKLRNETGSAIDSRLLFAIEDLLKEEKFDYILIDCPPSIELVTTNAIVALEAGKKSSMIIIPMKIDGYAIAGMDNTLATIESVSRERRTPPKHWKLLRTICEKRTTAYKEGIKIIQSKLRDAQFFSTSISKATAVSESSLVMRPLVDYDPSSTVANDYHRLAEEIEDLNG